MAEKKLIVHLSLCDGVVLNHASRGLLSVDHLINIWVADQSLGIVDGSGDWIAVDAEKQPTEGTLSYT